MSLHGRIEVNGLMIGGWSATRLRAVNPRGANVYKWRCVLNGITASGTLSHRYDEGAVVLAAKVLAAYTAARAGAAN